MSSLSAMRLSLALPVILISQAAQADLTPGEVWGDWRQYMQGMGYQVNASETPIGSDLKVSDITMSMQLPENEGAVSMSLGTLDFKQNGDGSVAIVMPAVMPMKIDITPQGIGQQPLSMVMNYTQDGHRMTASGASNDIIYDYAASAIGLSLQQMQIGQDSFGQDNAKIDVNANGVVSRTTMKVGAMRDYNQSMSVAGLKYDIYIDNPVEEAVVKITGGLSNLNFSGGGMIPLQMTNTSDVVAMLKAGFDVNGTFSYTDGSTQMNVTDPANGNFAANTSSGAGSFSVEMGKDSLGYGGEQTDVKVSAQVATLPFPINFSMAKSGFGLKMPINKTDQAEDVKFAITLQDFVMSDMIWGIFDPAGQLPRDPATIIMDMTGKVRMLVDLMDPDAAAAMGAQPPAEVEALTINQIAISAVGANLEGSGDFAFDNSDMTTFPGMPKPVGEVNLALAGGNGLLNKLVEMGFLPEDQAMGARMMMGLFGVPGEAPDTLSSKIEFTQGGQILANGQQIN